MSYSELLKDPRWQKKRLEIMERDEWTCQACRDTEATLTVHHKSYRMIGGKFVDIWEYPGDDLVTLCQVCHSAEEEILTELKKSMFFRVRNYCDDALAMEEGLIDLITSLFLSKGCRLTSCDFYSIATTITALSATAESFQDAEKKVLDDFFLSGRPDNEN